MMTSDATAKDNAQKTFFHCCLLPECPPCLKKHVESEGNERAAYKAMHAPLTAFDDFCTCPACFDGEPPQQHASGSALNKAIEAKAHQCDATRLHSCPNRKDAFCDVVARVAPTSQRPIRRQRVTVAGDTLVLGALRFMLLLLLLYGFHYTRLHKGTSVPLAGRHNNEDFICLT